MATEASEPIRSWLAHLLTSAFFWPDSSLAVRVVSGVFITLGIAFIAPIVSLITFDICLWLWRLYSLSHNAFLRRQRLLREQQRELRQQQQRQREARLKASQSNSNVPEPTTPRT